MSKAQYAWYTAGTWENSNFQSICPTAVFEPSKTNLESVSIYQTIDLLCEGDIAGLCDKHGNLIKITSDSSKNEDGLKAIYLNDVPVKNTDVNTLNYNRVFADFRIGSSDSRQLARFTNQSMSFTNAIQTINMNTQLPGLNESNEMIKSGRKFFVNVGRQTNSNSDAQITDNAEKEKIDISKRYAPSTKAVRSNAAYTITDADSLRKVRAAERAQPIAVTHIITNDSCTMAQIDMAIPNSLVVFGKKGDPYSAAVNFVIKVGYVDDELTIAEGGSIQYLFCSICGRTNSGYVRSHNIPLPFQQKDRDRFVKVFRVDREKGIESTKLNKGLECRTISEIVEENLTYPHSAIMGMIADGRAFAQPPTRRFDVKMLKVNVPNNYDAATRAYSGDWDGQFATEKQWTDNPAWIFYDLATNTRYGIGKYGFKQAFLDKWNLYSISKYCDELVPSGYSGKFPKVSFSIAQGGTRVSIDDSTAPQKGERGLNSRFPVGFTVCLFENKDGALSSNIPSGNDIDKSFKRIIFNPTYSNNTFSFTLVKELDVDKLFITYPDLKTLFLKQQQDAISNAKDYLLDYLLNNQNSDHPFVLDYINGEPLDIDIRSGYLLTQFPEFLPVLEPRFSCNIYLDKKQNAFNALNDIAAIFRGMIYWSSGYMFVANDQAKDAVMLFNNANVMDGVFSYSGSASTSRTTAITVRFNDAADSYKPKVEYAEDAAGIREYGYIEKEIIALGVTSRAQAHRLGKWMLYTNQTEIDTVQFTTGQEGSYLKPADVIKIQDTLKSDKRYGGRIVDIDYAAKTLTLDQGIKESIIGQKITCVVPKANQTVRGLNKKADEKVKLYISNPGQQDQPEGLSDAEIDESRQSQIKEFTISTVTENKVIKVTETTDQDFNLIKKGGLWSVNNNNSAFEIKPIEYRVLGVVENSPNEYQITAMMYNRTKFGAVDNSTNVEKTQQSQTQIIDIGNGPASLTGEASSKNIIEIKLNEPVPVVDAKFPISPELISTQSAKLQILEVDFSNLLGPNSVTSSNTGGYFIEVYKNGSKVSFSLDGFDNTSFKVVIGTTIDKGNINFQISRYDENYKMEDNGL